MRRRIKAILIALPILFVGGILTSPNVDQYGYSITKARQDIKAIELGVQLFRNDNGRLPTEAEGLMFLLEKPASANMENWRPILDRLPDDPWGNEYLYRVTPNSGKEFEIYSIGPNGIDDGKIYDDVFLDKKGYDCELYNDCRSLIHNFSFVLLCASVLMVAYLLMVGLYASISGWKSSGARGSDQ